MERLPTQNHGTLHAPPPSLKHAPLCGSIQETHPLVLSVVAVKTSQRSARSIRCEHRSDPSSTAAGKRLTRTEEGRVVRRDARF